jgi:hypothetical protein
MQCVDNVVVAMRWASFAEHLPSPELSRIENNFDVVCHIGNAQRGGERLDFAMIFGRSTDS